MVYSIFADLAAAVMISVAMYIVYRFVKPFMRRNEFDQAYYIAKLRKHSDPQDIDLDEEIKSLFRTELSFVKADKVVKDSLSSVIAIDNTFKEAEADLKKK